MKLSFRVHRERWHPDSYVVRLDGEALGTISEWFYGCEPGLYGWFVRADHLGIPWKNTWDEKSPPVSLSVAKAQVKEYVKQCLSKN